MRCYNHVEQKHHRVFLLFATEFGTLRILSPTYKVRFHYKTDNVASYMLKFYLKRGFSLQIYNVFNRSFLVLLLEISNL